MSRIIPLRRNTPSGPKLYFDLEATRDTWKLNQDILYEEDEKVYINGTIASANSTTVLRLELRKISPSF